jgi:hypothetical protein
MQNIIDEFNRYFEGDARAVIIKDRLEITIGSVTMVISLPGCVGVEATGPS